jgi:hypothetical protein
MVAKGRLVVFFNLSNAVTPRVRSARRRGPSPTDGLVPVRPADISSYVDLGQWLQRGLVGFAFYPFPNDRATRSLRLYSR